MPPERGMNDNGWMSVVDALGRPLRSLRLSVTDRCNIRCAYCMPELDYEWLPRTDLLTFEEMVRLVRVFGRLGVTRIRLTGGEPLLRRGLPALVSQLAAEPAVNDLAMTTNGILLARYAAALREAGLHRVTVSLDTLNPRRFVALTRFDHLAAVIEGIQEASRVFGSIKLDTVVMRGVNDDELRALVEFGRIYRAEVRFIEYMDVGGASRWTWDQVVTREEILAALASHYGPATPLVEESSAPADRYRLSDGTIFGIISSTSAPFCEKCDRARLTADGHWFRCLYAHVGTDLRNPLRAGASDDELARLIAGLWTARQDRGAVDRLLLVHRQAQITPTDDVHLHMHTRGG
jgi:cyclic pyranopterin phosphate synthase